MLCEMTMPMFFAGVQLQAQDQRCWLIDHLREVEVRAGFATAGQIGRGCETAWGRMAQAGRGPPYTKAPYWGKPEEPAAAGSPPGGPRPVKAKERRNWGVGVRGFEGEEPPPHGLKVEEGEEEETSWKN